MPQAQLPKCTSVAQWTASQIPGMAMLDGFPRGEVIHLLPNSFEGYNEETMGGQQKEEAPW